MSPRSVDALEPAAQRELEAVDAALAGRSVAADLTELTDLVHEVRAQRPSPRDSFAAELDDRVARGFAARPGERGRDGRRGSAGAGRERLARSLAGLRRGWMPALAAAASVLLALVVAESVVRDPQSTTGGGGGESAVAPSSQSSRQAPSGAAGEDGEVAAPTTVVPPSPPGQLPGRRDRRVERQASLTLSAEPERIDEVADGVIRVTDRHQGIVASSNVQSADDGRGGASFDLRVPVGRLRPVLADLSELAHVRSRTQSSQDVTAIHASADERLREALAERSSLLRQLARADTANQAESIRTRLRIVNGQIAAARAELSRLNERTSYATVAVAIQSDERRGSGNGSGWGPGDALADAAQILEFLASVAVVALALLLPLVAAGLALAYGARAVRRRRRERALDSR